MKQFVVDGTNLLERFLESIGQVVVVQLVLINSRKERIFSNKRLKSSCNCSDK